jgi:hypothetical protein
LGSASTTCAFGLGVRAGCSSPCAAWAGKRKHPSAPIRGFPGS